MFKNMRRTDRQSTKEFAVKLLETGEYGILSTADPEGLPYGVPVSYVYKDDCLYFHSATEGHKLDNITTNHKVSFCVVGAKKLLPEKFTTSYESVIAFGQTKEITGQEKKEALLALVAKYSPEFMEKGKAYIEKSGDNTTVIKVAIEQITGKVRPQ
ncbi:pyridoxamine 5'-phosphate oxidase family protein [Sporomusa acidovorans]|uniref:Pyridoxamine 5'-phosphate oxidase n=1 Tax=Sporomusa acidovorans (strain ATCC 49682 / DSM 3132 / Mol) TaxID=1123286 RepID=A0ABZ3J1H3_SPOA4|nr:pyridoxamine 5'-phosphate oxidase family protein [Sporomusa acidovorans]OZC22848.1 pyridoxamine 5'-phosphate oxidase [Sporomusa acidovorans DSM 3132]SDE52910.1 hypothetical protein SAMN04488499_101595 [Sporomusa acidovorans]